MKKIYILDGFGLIFRSYFAFFRNPLINSKGQNTSAVFGFFRNIFNVFSNYNPEHFVVAMDSKGPTFRKEMYPEYKANRDAAPEDLIEQIPIILDLLQTLGIPTLNKEGFEADDVIATIATACKESGDQCFIISNDKDLMQLVDDSTFMLKSSKSGGYDLVNKEDVFEDKGVHPGQIIDLLSLMGDSSDNIPGVTGIGPKTASKLLAEYKTLEGIYENLDKIKSKSQKEKLSEGKEAAVLSKRLVVLDHKVPLEWSWDSLKLEVKNQQKAAEAFADLEVRSLAQELGHLEEPKKEDAPKGTYFPILREEDLYALVDRIKGEKILALDVETDNLDELKASPVGICISLESLKGYYIPIKAPETRCLSEDLVRETLKPVLENQEIKIIGQNIKYDFKVLARWGIDLGYLYFDTMIAAWLLDSTLNSYSMDNLALDYLNYKTVHFADVVPKGQTFDQVPLDQAVEYAAEDADITYRLYEYFEPLLNKEGLWDLFESLEMPLVALLGRMELRGISLDLEQMSKLRFELEIELVALEEEIYRLSGKEFNIKSTQQLQQVLFEERGLKPVKKTKTGFSTDSSVLEILAKEDPIPQKILRHRMLSKLKSTYVDTLPNLVQEETGRIHTHFIQTGTATGRLSSRDPNLQNIPIREEEGRRIRRAFIPKDGCVFVSADYSQIELVILAHLSGDPGLSSAFHNGEDVHNKTAGLLFNCFPEMISPEQRRIAKSINFGVMYGMSSFRLSNELGISRKQAAQFIEDYFRQYKGIKQFIDKTVASAEESMHVSTMLGHRRRIPTINSRNKTEKSAAQRIAVNTPIQGSAADVVKKAMVNLDKALQDKGYRAKVLLQVHDELILEVPKEEVEEVKTLVKNTMEGALSLSVPLKASVEVGDSWGMLH